MAGTLGFGGAELRWRVVVLACAGACGHRWAWLPKNVACNSHVNLSNFEIGPLELQRLWAVLNFRVAELHATLGVWVLARDEAGARWRSWRVGPRGAVMARAGTVGTVGRGCRKMSHAIPM